MKKITVIKRNGNQVEFDGVKIEQAILKAMKYGSGTVDEELAKRISEGFCDDKLIVSIKEIEDYVYKALVDAGDKLTAKCYEAYRAVREYQRQKNTIDNKVLGLINGNNIESLHSNSNKDASLISTQRDLVAEEVSKDIALRMMLPPHLAQAHKDGLIYIHDLGHYLNPSFNCCLVNLDDMLQNGTVINGKLVEKPHSFRTACTIATQIIAQVASGQFGGQTITLSHLAPFVRISKDKFLKDTRREWNSMGFSYTEEQLSKAVDEKLKEEVRGGIQTFQYQINTLQTSNGQAPFLSVFMYINEYPEYEQETVMLIKEMLEQRIQGMKNEVGAWITPAFPKLLYVTDENNIRVDSEYYWLTQLASVCVSKRMMPDFISAKHMRANYEGNVFGCMGCRAWLSPYKGEVNNIRGEYKWYGRFNMGLTSLNLADVGLSAGGDEKKFWSILEDRLELCHESLMLRYDKLKDVNSDVSPIHWQYGAIARLGKHQPIFPLLQDGYATITLGYIGLYECVMALIGKSHTSPEGEKLALSIMNYLKAKIVKWKEETGLGFALYGTPSESLTEYFAHTLQHRFGVIKGITDRNYLTNSYHVFVQEEINAFDKLKFEAQFHPISSGGAISYVELPNLAANPEVILTLIKYMYENVQYAEMNTKLDFCMECGYEGEILCDDNLEWYCPNCGNRDRDRMNVVRRTCGYLGENFWNEGRTQEIKERVMHL
ncbi:MAG: anaerobic ribonucleoside-triphosphate reductase [Oscillospiraceae bacterium]